MTAPQPAHPDVIHRIEQREVFDALFQQGASVTAGAPSELKFLIDRGGRRDLFPAPEDIRSTSSSTATVLRGPLSNAAFNELAYNRPDRTFIAGTVTAYDSFVDPARGVAGIVCFSLWPTDRFDVALLSETHAAVTGGLDVPAGRPSDVAFRPGGPKQQAWSQQDAQALARRRHHRAHQRRDLGRLAVHGPVARHRDRHAGDRRARPAATPADPG